MDIQQELRALIVALNRESIEYALCGGLAVAFHGYARFTKDIDILIAEESLESALKVAEEVGFLDSSGRIPFPNLNLYRVLKTEGTEYLILDWMAITTNNNAIWNQKTWFDWEGLPICVVSVEGLVTMKRQAGRDQDLLDIKMLGFEP
ncbi:MAG: hypothetical protein SFV81_18435 [Pirellulaceae bacterium]|nr:hypothetical protein [Pirellulaceae bacterium]